jgi:hypothetical protein
MYPARILALLALAACAGSPSPSPPPVAPPAETAPPPPPVTGARIADAAPPEAAPPPPDAAVASAEPAPDPPDEPLVPASAFEWICTLGESGSENVVLAVKDEGKKTPTMGVASATSGPFRAITEKTFQVVIEGKDLADPDLRKGLTDAKFKPAEIAKIMVYGIAAGGFGFGVLVVWNRAGKVVGTASWRMRPALMRRC